MNVFSCRLRQFSSSALRSCVAKSWKREKVKKEISSLGTTFSSVQVKRRFVDFKRIRVCGGKGGGGLMSFKR